ncbi:MAG: phospholipase, partial [Solirubrobacteraceae bacterium]|nr:phospholipase [Solirubrobacteraceae bacterium]
MDYYDGNTVTGLWNYAQHFAMSDNSYSDTFGPSTPGAMNVTAGNTYGALCGPATAVYKSVPCAAAPGSSAATPGAPQPQGSGTTYSDADPNYDVCSATQDGRSAASTIQMGGQNVGDLLNQHNVSWGWFQGGFASPNYVSGQPNSDNLSAVCTGTHQNVGGAASKDYSPHHEPFQYYASTANPKHLPPTSVGMIGHQDPANHQYDLKDFWAAADNGNLPSVSYLKAAEYQDGHAGYSDPIDEQHFLVNTINHLQHLSSWKNTAVVIAYDDSDGWYDHQMSPTLTQSQTPVDALTGTGRCGTNPPPSGQPARCGYGPRQPLLVISPFSRRNFVDGTTTSQSSVVRFIEDNWMSGQRIGG